MADVRPETKRQKLPRLPKNVTVSKRPLLRPAIPSPYSGSGSQKVVYISSRTPFMSAVKRVQKLLHQVEARAAQSAAATTGSRKRKYGASEEGDRIAQTAAALAAQQQHNKDRDQQREVVMKATGKAIEKALGLALWFQQREGFGVRIETGSIGAIDDIVPVEGGSRGDGNDEDEKSARMSEGVDGDADMDDADADGRNAERSTTEAAQPEDEIPETRIRYASTIEVAVFAS
ncbi:hypothetical protein MBLNU459_g3938t1 [Dothideomycetes sp. NU459]